MTTADRIPGSQIPRVEPIDVLLDPARLFRWHLWLIEALREIPGARVAVRFAETGEPLPQALHLLLDLERLTLTNAAEHALDRIERPMLDTASPGDPMADSLVIDLSCTGAGGYGEGRRMVPAFDGVPGENALWSAILDRRAPHLAVMWPDGKLSEIGQPAVEAPHILTLAADTVLSRLVQGIVRIASHGEESRARGTMASSSVGRAGAPIGAIGRFAIAELKTKVGSALRRLLGTAPRWQVAYRHTPDCMNTDVLANHYVRLRDDSNRYFADPFLFHKDGRHFLFVEEYPYATGRGLISMAIIDADGTIGRPKPVLERPYHLSYPQVFERDGQIWMMPESAGCGALELYRADPFPDRWVLEAKLLVGWFHDATLVDDGGRLWIAAATEAWRSSTWDCLALFHADKLLGPWTPHALNPVLISAGSARPAGHFIRKDGALFRPAQDCSAGYGSSLTLARVEQLDESGFKQRRVGTMRLSPDPDILGPHTYNWAAGLAAIDFFACSDAGIPAASERSSNDQ